MSTQFSKHFQMGETKAAELVGMMISQTGASESGDLIFYAKLKVSLVSQQYW